VIHPSGPLLPNDRAAGVFAFNLVSAADAGPAHNRQIARRHLGR
jgi:hypothetical protein